MNAKLVIQIAIGVAGYLVWGLMAWFDPAVRQNFLDFNIAMAIGTIGLVLRDMKSSDTPPPQTKQDGRALPLFLLTVFLAGCAGLNVSWNASYNMPQIAGQVNPLLTVATTTTTTEKKP